MPGQDRHTIDRIARRVVSGTAAARREAEVARIVAERMRSKLAAAGIAVASFARVPARRASRRAPTDARLVDLVNARVDKLLADRALAADARTHAR